MSDRPFHRVFDGKRPLGFVSPSVDMPGMWSVYGEDKKRMARIAPDPDAEGRFQVMLEKETGMEYLQARSLESAVAVVFGLPSLLRLDPPLPRGSGGW